MPATLLKKAILGVALIPAMTAAFLLALAASLSLDDATIAQKIVDDLDFIVRDRADNGRTVDSLTECTGLSFGIPISATPQSAVKEAIHAPTVLGCPWLESFITGERSDADAVDYFRYWHGYAVLTRPFLSVLPYTDLRQHLLTVSLALLGVLLWRIGADFGPKTSLAFALAYLVLNAFAYWIVATKAVTWFLMMGGALVMSRRASDPTPVLAFFILGALTAFFDFLTAPIAVYSTAALVYGLYAFRAGRADHLTGRIAIAFAFFFAGYAGLWLMKFVVASYALEAHVWRDAMTAAAIRLRGSDPNIDSLLPGAAIWSNIERLKDFWAPVALILAIAAPLATRRSRACLSALRRQGGALLLAAAFPLVWLELLSNHSQIHAHFTQLNLAPMLTLLTLAALGESAHLDPAPTVGLSEGARTKEVATELRQ